MLLSWQPTGTCSSHGNNRTNVFINRPHVARISIGTSVVMTTVSPGDVCTLSNVLIHTHGG